MREGASPGVTGVPIAVWKSLPLVWFEAVVRLLSLVEEGHQWPDNVLAAYVAMIPKASGGFPAPRSAANHGVGAALPTLGKGDGSRVAASIATLSVRSILFWFSISNRDAACDSARDCCHRAVSVTAPEAVAGVF